MDGLKQAKKRKLTDKNVPNSVLQNPDFAEDSKMYQSLLEMERKLDWTMTRKRVEIQDALARVPSITRTLRIFLSHTVSNQPWQVGADSGALANLETGEGIPSWALKIEGRLLELPNPRSRDKGPQRKFSTFIKKMVVELDRDPTVYPDGNIVEWPRGPNNTPLDGFTIRRMGDMPTKVRVLIYPDQNPEQFKISGELGSIIGLKEDSRTAAVQALWSYIKINNLQDKADRRMVHADDKLRVIFDANPMIQFQKLPEVVNRFLLPPDPIALEYTLDPSQPPPERPLAWDVDLKTEDTAMKGRMNILLQTSKETLQHLGKLDDEIAIRAQSLHNSNTKRVFLESFAKDPAQFIQTWLESQTRDLDTILGSGPSEGLTVRQEELKRSEFFRLPWVEEAVAVQEGFRLAARS